MRELIVDNFAGGGGASTGIELALGLSPDIAINHDGVALAMHQVNHPATKHLCNNVWKVDPDEIEGPIGLGWFSPDCKHFSKAKGGKPVEKGIRDLAWVVVRWARRRQGGPRVIILENVEEFSTWGPLGADGRPCPDRKGATFKRWTGELRRLGYAVEWRELRACDFGAPTIRKRLFLIARRDGAPIVWPAPTHAHPDSEGVKSGRLKPWRTAAEIIDWSLPCPSIFDSSEDIMRKHGLRAVRPLQEATMARIAKGVKRYVLDAAKPFIVPITHTGDVRAYDIGEPLRTITTASRGEQALVTPFLAPRHNTAEEHYEPRTRPIDEPLATITAKGNSGVLVAPHLMTMRNAGKPVQGADQATHTITAGGAHMHLVSAFLAKHFGGNETPGWPIDKPISTVTAQDHHAVVAANLSHQYGSGPGQGDPEKPARTISAGGQHHALVASFLSKYYGPGVGQPADDPLHTATVKARFGVVTVLIEGEPFVITDIGMRMLTPRELFRAQGFPDSYVIDRKPDGSPITKTDQVSKCGNSVCPPLAAAIVAANFAPREIERHAEQRGEFYLQAAE